MTSNNTKYYKYFFGCTCSKCMKNEGIFISETNKISLDKCPYCNKSVDVSFGKGMIGDTEVSEILPDGTEYEFTEEEISNSVEEDQSAFMQENNQNVTEPIVHCPYCNSNDCYKLNFLDRGTSFLVFGFGSGKIGKQWHCNSCKSDF